MLHTDVIVLSLLQSKAKLSGSEQFRNHYRRFFDSNPGLNCLLKSRIVLDNAIIDEEWITGISNAPNGVHAVAIYGFRHGLIDRFWFPT